MDMMIQKSGKTSQYYLSFDFILYPSDIEFSVGGLAYGWLLA